MMPPEWGVVARIMVQEHQKAVFGDADPARGEAVAIDRVSRFAVIRCQIGAALVRAGERLQGAQRPEVAANTAR